MKRLEATHFIEVWRGQYTDAVYNEPIKAIEDIRYISGVSGFGKTIAIWKIKYKEAAHV